MDRSLDETIAERQRNSNRGRRGPPPAPRRREYNYPRDGVRKPARDERTNLDNDWVHDRYDDEQDGGRRAPERPRERNLRRDDDRDRESDRKRPAKLRVDNLHYDLNEDDIWDLFTRIAPVMDAKLRYDRAGRSEGVAFVTYEHVEDARAAIREFDRANAKGQPIRLTLLPLPRRDNPFDRVENPKSLFDRIEAPGGGRRRSDSPAEEGDDDRGARRGPRRGGAGPRDRRSDTTKPPPENIDRYIPGQRDSRSSSHRGGRRPGERRERGGREADGQKMSNGRPRKTVEELDAEMNDYWGSAGNGQGETGDSNAPAGTNVQAAGGDDIDMIE